MSSHYVPGNNAHIDTQDFVSELNRFSEGGSGKDLDDMEFEEIAYEAVERVLSDQPDAVPPATVICRYLNTERFLWFLKYKTVYLGRVDGFDDARDCSVPEDYDIAVSQFYEGRSCSPEMWQHYSESMRHRWLISCWTEISTSVDDYLLWYRYAGGSLGVGITVNYDVLKRELERGISKFRDNEPDRYGLVCGYVNYGDQLKIMPFNKRRMFKNECEIRFVTQSDLVASLQIPVSRIFKKFGLRFSPDTPMHHRSAIEEVWLKFGGSDNFVIAEN